MRVFGHHGLSLQVAGSRRNAHFFELAESFQTVETVSLLYTYLCDTDLGAVEWPLD